MQNPGKEAFFAHKNNTNQTGVLSASTAITFGTESFDTGGKYDTGTNRWTPSAGTVWIGAQVSFQANSLTNGGTCTIWIAKNGTITRRAQTQIANVSASFITLQVAWVDQCNGTDFYSVFAQADSPGSNAAVIGGGLSDTCFQGHKI